MKILIRDHYKNFIICKQENGPILKKKNSNVQFCSNCLCGQLDNLILIFLSAYNVFT